MLSIQQLIKALRKLQNTNNSGGDLIRQSLKYAAAASANSTSTPGNEATTMSPTIVTSLLTKHDVTSLPQSPTKSTTAIAPKHEQQKSNSSQQTMTAATAVLLSSLPVNGGDCAEASGQQQQQHTVASVASSFSLISYLPEYGLSTANSITQQDTDSAVDKVDTTVAAAPSATTTKTTSHLRRSQQIQNFYQQQLHHFHTQHNQSLYTKQKQTQFAMSSLAAEPLALKQQQDDIVGAVTSSSSSSSGSSNNNKAANGSANSGNCYDTADAACSNSASSASSKPCFNTGLSEILQFMELIGNLKHTKRTGWVLRDVDDCESISGHMYRMSMMTFLLDGTEGLNQIRCMELALVHDLAESLVGDITPFCGVSKDEKRSMEFKAMDDICKLIEPRGKRIMELFEEYEHGQSAESKFVKDLDRLDMVMQAFEYEKRDDCLLKHQEFFDSTEGKFKHPFVKKLVNEIYEQRKVLAKAKGATPPPKIEVPNMEESNRNGHCDDQQEAQQKSSSTSS